MKALQVVRPKEFVAVDMDPPRLEPNVRGRLIVKTRWVSLCGSDIPFFTGRKRFNTYPLRPGQPAHECVGQVVESTSEPFRPGAWVLAVPEADKGLAEFFVAEAAKAVQLPAEAALAESSCLIQPLSTVLNALDRLGEVEGRSAVVIGLGSIGLLFCWLLKLRGARRIVGIDPVADRCRWAEMLGVDQALPLSGLELVHAVRQNLPGWAPPDLCIEAVGHQMDTVNDCLELVRKMGTVLAFGVPDHPVYALEYEIFFRKNASLVAAVTPDWSVYLPRARDLFLPHQAEFEAWITHRLPIGEAGRAFRLYAGHEDGIVKTVLDAEVWE
jgi:L-iditol 2-dehydrogenase